MSSGRASSPPPVPPKPRSLCLETASHPVHGKLLELGDGVSHVPAPPPFSPPGPGEITYVRLFVEVQDLKNTDGFMGKMTGDVSDPFCVFFVKDLRANSGVASAKKQRVGRTELIKNKLTCKFKRSVIIEWAPIAPGGEPMKQIVKIKVLDRDKTRKGKTEDENLGEAKFDMDTLMQAPDRRLNLKNSVHGSIIVTAEPMSGVRNHDLTFDVSCKSLAKKDVMGGSDPYITMHVPTAHGAGKSGAGVCMFSNRKHHKSGDLNPTFPTIDTLNSLQLCNNDFDRKIKVTVLDWDPEKGFAGTMSMLGGLGKKIAHSKDQAAAAEHVGSGTGKNDEPIGYCFLSLNEMLAHSAKGESIPLLHPKGKDKPCGTICIRLKAVPRLSEDEIASNLQLAQSALDSASASAASKAPLALDAADREKAARDAAAESGRAAADAARLETQCIQAEEAAKHAIAPAEAQVAAAKAEMEAAIARFNALEKGLQAARQDVLRHHEEVAAARKKNEAAAAEEKRKKDEQHKAEETAARLAADLKAAELLKHTAEANIEAMQKQSAEMERRRLQKAVDAEEKEVSSADSD